MATISVEEKSSTPWPENASIDESSCSVDGVERVSCVDRQDAPSRSCILVEDVSHGVDCTFDACFHSGTQLIHSTGFFHVHSSSEGETFSKNSSETFTDADWPYSRTFIKGH